MDGLGRSSGDRPLEGGESVEPREGGEQEVGAMVSGEFAVCWGAGGGREKNAQ